mmetsp:Transcript_48153/g.119284  ORF Transcript_48153/g.119284 Transcript_48153/m.119284 type:complete len:82 (-) Transcript_48153:2006-2251(-)
MVGQLPYIDVQPDRKQTQCASRRKLCQTVLGTPSQGVLAYEGLTCLLPVLEVRLERMLRTTKLAFGKAIFAHRDHIDSNWM